MSEAPELSIIVVSFRVPGVVLECLQSLVANPPSRGWEVVVVDNRSGDGTPALIRERFPAARVIENQANLGFAAANAVGERASGGEYLLYLNNDTLVPPGALEALCRELDRDPSVGAVGPRMIGRDGRLQPTRMIATSLAGEFLQRLLGRGIRMNLPLAARILESRHARPARAAWLNGACLLVRRTVIKQVGGFDPGYFLYFEDSDLCRRIARGGWQVRYTPVATVTHLGGESAARNSRRVEMEYRLSQLRFYRRNRPRPEYWLLKAYLATKFTVAMAAAPRGSFKRRFLLSLVGKIWRHR